MSLPTKQRTNVTLRGDLLEVARALDLNVSAIAEAALAAAVREAGARAWVAENAEAIAQREQWIERNGLPLAPWQAWTRP